jgi:hypothetical protein
MLGAYTLEGRVRTGVWSARPPCRPPVAGGVSAACRVVSRAEGHAFCAWLHARVAVDRDFRGSSPLGVRVTCG